MHFQTCVHKEIESNKTVPIISFFLYLANIVRTVYAIIICCICMYMYLSKFKQKLSLTLLSKMLLYVLILNGHDLRYM